MTEFLKLVINRLFGSLLMVLRGFKRNQGLLLSGAVAYYTLLSIVPMSILALIVLSHFMGEEQLFHTLSTYIEAVALILLLGAQVIAELERKTDELTGEKLSGFET